MMKNRILGIIFLTAILTTLMVVESRAEQKKRLPHHEYGNVLMNNLSEKNNIAPVVFNHWLHRSMYTCRLCHEDLNFSMKRNATKVDEEANKKGKFCGACHNGKEAFGPGGDKNSGQDKGTNCNRCHSHKVQVEFKTSFYPYTKNLPRTRFGNGINWIKAEKTDQMTVKDSLTGNSVKNKNRMKLTDSVIKPDEPEMPQIVFSHDKHALWNGCTLCHPEPFKEANGSPKFTMEEVIDGKFCGICHGKVAFPILDCQRCHVKPTILGR